MSTIHPPVRLKSPAPGPIDFFRIWNLEEAAHLAVIGRIGDGRAAIVDRMLDHFARLQATTSVLYTVRNPQLTKVTNHAKGAAAAAAIVHRHLSELHARYSAIERRKLVALDPILIVVDSLAPLLATTTDPRLKHRLQLNLEAIAILGKEVNVHLVLSGDEIPHLAVHARKDLGFVAIANGQDALPIGAGWFFAPRSTGPWAVRFDSADGPACVSRW